MNDKRTWAEMVGKALRKAGVLVAVVGTLAIGFRGGDFSLHRTAIAIAVGLALFAAGVTVEERRR
jgi:hypothetical protein